MKQQLLPVSILLEAKMLYFGNNPSLSRHKENVMARQAFANAFIKRAKTVDIAAVLNKNHATIVHYRKNHDWDLKYKQDYKEAFNRAVTVYEQYNPKSDEPEFLGMDNVRLLSLVKELKNRVHSQEIVIDEQRKEIEKTRNALRMLTS